MDSTFVQQMPMSDKTYTQRLSATLDRDPRTDDGKKMANPFTKLKPPSTSAGIFIMIIELFAMWLSQLALIVCALLGQFLFVAILLILWVVIYYLRYFWGDGLQLIEDSYELAALTVNYGIDKRNWAFELFRPFIPIFNLYIYVNKIFNQIFWLVMTPSFVVYLLHKVIDLIWQLMPVVLDVLIALMQVFAALIPELINIAAALFDDAIIQTVMQLIQVAINIILALVPVLPQLIPILAIFIRLVVDQLQQYFVVIMDILVQIINAVIPFVISLVPELVATANAISAGIASAPQPIQPFDYVVILFTASIGLVIKIVVGVFELLMTVVVDNAPKIVAFLVSFLGAMTRLIEPVIVAVINIVTTQLATIISLVLVLVQAFINMIPMIYDIVQDLLLSGVFEALIAAVIEGFTAPHSPVFLTTIFEKLGEVIETNLHYAIEAIKTMVNIVIILLPILINIITQLVSSNILVIFLKGVMGLIATALPLFVNLFMSLLLDVFFDVILRILLENFSDLFSSILESVVILLSGLMPFLLRLLIAVFLSFIQLIPKLLMIIAVILAGSGVLIVQLLAAITQLIVDLLFSENFIFVLLKMMVSVINVFTKTLLGFEMAPLQFIVDFFFRIINPFFAMIGASINLDTSNVNIDNVDFTTSPTSGVNGTIGGGGSGGGSGGGTTSNEPDYTGALFTFFGKLDILIKGIGYIAKYLGYVLYLFKYLSIGIEYSLKYAIIGFEYVVKPAACTIDATCCFFIHLDCCWPGFPQFCTCYCNSADWGCPIPEWSCIF